MQCPKCNTDNPESARFCMNCAAPLALVCAKCGTELPPAAKFCFNCAAPVAQPASPDAAKPDTVSERLQRLVPKEYAERLLATRGQVGKERRIVTILFSDVKGSTAMAENLDPEEVMEIMDGAFDVLIEPVYRYEGTLARLMGDAVLAFFGAPIAHEDDPERAIRAALEITAGAAEYAEKLEQERGIKGFNVRVGINTGLVVVGEVGSDLRVEYTAMGDAINLAARMESAAEPGTVLITEATHKWIAPLFQTEALGPVEVKGKKEPVPVFRVLGAKEAPGKVRGIPGLESPLVGRDTEIRALQEAMDHLQAGVGGIVTIIGEAGIGKSRLVAEVRRDVALLRLYNWAEGRCLSYGTSMAYLLWLDLLRHLLAVGPEDSPQAVRDSLRQRVQNLCADLFDHVYPYLARLMSLPLEDGLASKLNAMDGQDLKANTFRAIETLIECAASERPLVLVCEDLHWADPTSIELLERLLALTDRASVLLICLSRALKGHGSWRIRETAARDYEHRHTDIWLKPLSAGDSAMLVGNLLQAEVLAPGLKERILEVAEGNPFYVEEILRSLLDQQAILWDEAAGSWEAADHAAHIVLPHSLQGVLLARIDRLREDSRRVLQMASVIGRIFLYQVLQAIAEQEQQLDRHLLSLQQEQMIRERARIPELEYIFKHELTREVAYNGLLKKERRTFHRQVAEALEHLFPERIEEQLGLLAYHWERAEDAQKATAYLLRAGDQARLAYAHREAIDYYQRALHFLQQQEHEQAARTWMKLGLTYHTAFDFQRSRQAYDKGFVLWQNAGQEARAACAAAAQTLRVAVVEPTTLDPSNCTDLDSIKIVGQLFSALVQLTPEQDVVPDAARSWEIAAGGRAYVFHLREGMQWSDGRPVTAGDFLSGFRRALANAMQTGADVQWSDIQGVRAYLQKQLSDLAQVGVRAPDDVTLVIELEQPTSYILQLLSWFYAVPRHLVDAYGESWTEPATIVTNGPFRVRARQPGTLLVLERNPNYHGRFSGNVQRVEAHILRGETTSHLDAYEHGDLDIANIEEAPAELERVRQQHAGEYVSAPELWALWMGFDLTRPPFHDTRVRRAFALALDREAMARQTGGYAVPGTGGVVPPGMPGHSPGIALPYRPQVARDLLAQAGYGEGAGMRFPRVELWYPTRPAVAAPVECLIDQWQQVLGVELGAEAVEWAAYLARLAKSLPHISAMCWAADYPDPDNFLRAGMSDYRRGGSRQPYEELLERARHITDQSERMRLYRQADRMVVEEALVLPLTYRHAHYLVKPWVKSYPLSSVAPPFWKDVIIEPH